MNTAMKAYGQRKVRLRNCNIGRLVSDEVEAQALPSVPGPERARITKRHRKKTKGRRGRKKGTPSHNGSRDPGNGLSRKESEVYKLAVKGLKAKEIGEELGISHRTAQGHIRRVLSKLGLRHKYELVAHAKQRTGGR